MAIPDVLTAIERSAPRPGLRWTNGPVCFSGEHKQYVARLTDYLQLTAEVERRIGDLREAAQRLRLIYYGRTVRNPAFDRILDTDDRWSAAPLTIDHGQQDTIDALMRTGYVDFGPDAAGTPRPLVDISHLWVLLDAWSNGLKSQGSLFQAVTSVIGLLSWTGDLGSLWDEYNTTRLKERAAALKEGKTWAEDPADLATPLGWLRKGTPVRCPSDDLLGDLDAVVLFNNIATHDLSGPTPLTSLIADYYLNNPRSSPGQMFSVENRFHLFVRNAIPPIPHDVNAQDRVTLKPEATAVIRSYIEDSAFWLIFVSRLGNPGDLIKYALFGPPGAFPDVTVTTDLIRRGVLDELRSPWGKAVLGQITDDFVAFLNQGLANDGWTIGDWPTMESPLKAYGGYELQIGDQDSTGRYGGTTHAGASHVAHLQQQLIDSGFSIVTAADGQFGPKTAIALREFQIEASQDRILACTAGPAMQEFTREAIRRYHGPVNGVLTMDTAFVLEHWCDPTGRRRDIRERVPPEVDRIVNPLRIQSRQAAASGAGPLLNGDVWRHDDERDVERRLWALDRLERYPVPDAETVAGHPGLIALGRYVIDGPVCDARARSLWQSTVIRLDGCLPPPPPPLTFTDTQKSTYRVLRAIAKVECVGHWEGFNGWDAGRVSFGVCHWALMVKGVGELAPFLALFRHRDPSAYRQSFGRFGVEPEADWDPTSWDHDGAHAQAKWAGRIAMYGLRDEHGDVYKELRPLAARTSATGLLVDDYLVDWLRSWRGVFRIVMALRLSLPLQLTMWPATVLRLQSLLNRDFASGTGTDVPVVTEGGITRIARFGDIFTSEQAVGVLLRWHVNRPGKVLNSSGAIEAALAAYQNVYGTGRVDISVLDDATATARQKALATEMVALAPEGWFRDSVEDVRTYQDSEHGRLKDTSKSFLLAQP